jgi:hypothetical protein
VQYWLVSNSGLAQDLAYSWRATASTRSKYTSAFAASGSGDSSAISPATRLISASVHFFWWDRSCSCFADVAPSVIELAKIGVCNRQVQQPPGQMNCYSEPVLYLGRWRNSRVDELPAAQSETLLEELWQFVDSPQFSYEHRREVGDLVLCYNRLTMHRRDAFDNAAHRIVHRTLIKGKWPPKRITETLHKGLATHCALRWGRSRFDGSFAIPARTATVRPRGDLQLAVSLRQTHVASSLGLQYREP